MIEPISSRRRFLSSRRRFLQDMMLTLPLAAAVPAGAARTALAAGGKLHVSCNQYPWAVFYGREGRDFGASLDTALAEVAASGIDGFEPGVGGLQQVQKIAPLLKKHGLEMRSLYVNSTLHEAGQVDRSIEQVLAAAAKAKAVGTRIIVTNPSPIRWGGPENKDDEQLKTQAAALNTLGAELRRMGLTLAYHNHDIELRQAAREFHHMMVGTGPKNVTLCLDAHWVYRGAGNSAPAPVARRCLDGGLRTGRYRLPGPRRVSAENRRQAAAGSRAGGRGRFAQHAEGGRGVQAEHAVHAARIRRFRELTAAGGKKSLTGPGRGSRTG